LPEPPQVEHRFVPLHAKHGPMPWSVLSWPVP
jgi:hypothetical protein